MTVKDTNKIRHDILGILKRLEIQMNLIIEKDFKHFSKDEVIQDNELDLKKLTKHFEELKKLIAID